jgi:hypothetical protein
VPERTLRNEASPPEIIGEHFWGLRTDISNLELEELVMEEEEAREKSMEVNAGFKQ